MIRSRINELWFMAFTSGVAGATAGYAALNEQYVLALLVGACGCIQSYISGFRVGQLERLIHDWVEANRRDR